MRTKDSYVEAGKLGYLKSDLQRINKEKSLKCFEKYISNPKKCGTCGKDIPYEKRFNSFCSSSCSATFNNRGIRRHGEPAGNCIACGQAKAKSKRLYCSNSCQRKFEWEKVKQTIVQTKVLPKSSRVAKRYLKEVSGIECIICRTKEWMGKEVPLVLDHINGNSDDWSLTNLRLICGNCDMQTSTYKNKNKGNGRFYRRIRYKNGQSY